MVSHFWREKLEEEEKRREEEEEEEKKGMELGIYMEMYGNYDFVWNTMGLYGLLWISMNFWTFVWRIVCSIYRV